jgi:hypothetical protein
VDAFKVTILLAIILSLSALGVIVSVAEYSISNATIPDFERGLVTSKAPVTDKPSVSYAVALSDGRTLYIRNDTVLYDSIMENHTYLFDCRIDHNNNMLLIKSVNPQGGLVISKALVTDKPSIGYAVNLANGRTLYIASNATLYDSIVLDKTYLFDCQNNFNNMLLINGAQPLDESIP